MTFQKQLGMSENPNWRSHMFQRGGLKPPTSISVLEDVEIKDERDMPYMLHDFLFSDLLNHRIYGDITAIEKINDDPPKGDFLWQCDL